MKGFAWNRQKGEPRRRGPATSLPFESAIELVDVIWHFLPALVMPAHPAMAHPSDLYAHRSLSSVAIARKAAATAAIDGECVVSAIGTHLLVHMFFSNLLTDTLQRLARSRDNLSHPRPIGVMHVAHLLDAC